jgi:hypothetical protein
VVGISTSRNQVIEQLGISPRSNIVEDLGREIPARDSIPGNRSFHSLVIPAVDVDTNRVSSRECPGSARSLCGHDQFVRATV